jgi:hypothetical protein
MKLSTLARPLALAAAISVALAPALARADQGPRAKHVVVISVDGLHQTDLESYVATHAGSTLAKFVDEGASYSNARTPFPSDSFPGLTAIVTGANPKSAGIYYDDSWNRSLVAPIASLAPGDPGITDCTTLSPGVEVTYFEQLDKNLDSIDAGQGVVDNTSHATIASTIYGMSKQARDGIDATQLPRDPKNGCAPVYPHAYLRVNSMFEVAKNHGLHTAWSDKHEAYDLVNGPSGAGVDDLFAPEINSVVPHNGDDWTKDNLNTQFYDALKVEAVIRWSKGYDHNGTDKNPAGQPAIYGMNFQSVSTAQKLNKSNFGGRRDANGAPLFDSVTDSFPTAPPSAVPGYGLGGYSASGSVAGDVVAGALDFVDGQLGRIVASVDPRDTMIVVTAKHGQAPDNRLDLRLIDDAEVIAAVEAAWAARPAYKGGNLVAFWIADDEMLIWLNDRSQQAANFAKQALLAFTPTLVGASDASGNFVARNGQVSNSGLAKVYAGHEASKLIGVKHSDDRVPDVIGIAKEGTVYSSPTKIKKIAEHGGDHAADRHVPIVAWGAGVRHVAVDDRVETTQVAPTVLEALGLPAAELQGVQLEGTDVLPKALR